MARHYYAIYNPYGIGTVDVDGYPFGCPQVFDTREERDKWVDEHEDYNNGNPHTHAMSGKAFRDCVTHDSNFIAWCDMRKCDWQYVKRASAGELAEWWDEYLEDCAF